MYIIGAFKILAEPTETWLQFNIGTEPTIYVSWLSEYRDIFGKER